MIDSVGRFMAGLASVAFTIALAIASIWLTTKIMKRLPDQPTETREMGLGCVIWLVLFMALALLFGPSIHVLESYSCGKAEDYERCMDPPEPD